MSIARSQEIPYARIGGISSAVETNQQFRQVKATFAQSQQILRTNKKVRNILTNGAQENPFDTNGYHPLYRPKNVK